MMIRGTRTSLALALCAATGIAQGGLTAYPSRVTLDSGLDAHRLVVVSSDAQGITVDVCVTREELITVDGDGVTGLAVVDGCGCGGELGPIVGG